MVTTFDASSFLKGIDNVAQAMFNVQKRATSAVAEELLRLSQMEVPHDKGILAGTGVVVPDGNNAIVGYNTPYAKWLHEHPELNFKKGRKGKYLEEPMKRNNDVFVSLMGKIIKGDLKL